jgi:V/A-type H+-transporting ATPase subunit F
MSYANFIPTVSSEAIQRELERKRVYVEDCNRSFEGAIKQKGDTVRILGVGKPTIKSILKKNASGDIDGPEEVEDTSVSLTVDQIRYFNYMVGDIDKAQSVGGVMEALNKESAEGLANEEDTYVSGLILGAEVKKLIRRLAENEYAILYVTEDLADEAASEIERYSDSRLPAIILIPSKEGASGNGLMNVRKAVERAVGADILFGGEE